jgi:glycosyltransferase involved in cell wall biosynthesis
MSRGVCVVATRVGGPADVLNDGVDGILTEPGDAGALADAALILMNDVNRARSMSAAAIQTAHRYSWDRVARETTEFYARRLEARFG